MAKRKQVKAFVKRIWGGRTTKRVMVAGSFATVAAAAIILYATFQLLSPVQSYPIVGGVWEVDFNVFSTVPTDLTLHFIKPTTRDDLQYEGLYCNGIEVPHYGRKSGVTWSGGYAGGYYYKWYNYQCDGITTWKVTVLTSGYHHQRIVFGRIRQDIFNEARLDVKGKGVITRSRFQPTKSFVERYAFGTKKDFLLEKETGDFNISISPIVTIAGTDYSLDALKAAYPSIGISKTKNSLEKREGFKWALILTNLPFQVYDKIEYVTLSLGYNGHPQVDINSVSTELWFDEGEIILGFGDLIESGFKVDLFRDEVIIRNIPKKPDIVFDPTITTIHTSNVAEFESIACQMYGNYVFAFWNIPHLDNSVWRQFAWGLSSDGGDTWTTGDYNILTDANRDALTGNFHKLLCYYNHTAKKIIVTAGISLASNSGYINEITYSANPTDMLTKRWEVGNTAFAEIPGRHYGSSDMNTDNFVCEYSEVSNDIIQTCVDTDLNVIQSANYIQNNLIDSPAGISNIFQACNAHTKNMTAVPITVSSGDLNMLFIQNDEITPMSGGEAVDNFTGWASNCIFSHDDANLFMFAASNVTLDANIYYCNNPSPTNCDQASEWHMIPTPFDNQMALTLYLDDSDNLYLGGQNGDFNRMVFYDNNAAFSDVNWLKATRSGETYSASAFPLGRSLTRIGQTMWNNPLAEYVYIPITEAPPVDEHPTVHVFQPESWEWEGGDVNIDLNLWDDSGINSAWVDSNISSDCFVDENTDNPDFNVFFEGDMNFAWNSKDADCATLFDVNMTFRAYDSSLDGSQVSYSVEYHIDNIPPVTVDNAINTWSNSDVNVDFNCTDVGSGRRNFYYSLNDANSQVRWGADLNIGVVVTTDLNHEIYYWSDDITGDTNESLKLIYAALDKTIPTGFIIAPIDGNQWNDSSVVTFDVNDNLSRVDVTTIQVDINGTTSADFDWESDCTLVADTNFHCSYTESAFDVNGQDYNVTIFMDDNASNGGRDTSITKWIATPDLNWGNVNDYYVDDTSGIDLYLGSLIDLNISPFGQNDTNGIFNVYNNSSWKSGSINFHDGFESGAIGSDWTEYTSNAYGRIQVLSTGIPHGGSYHVGMDSSSSPNVAVECIYTTMNFNDMTDIDLNFWIKESGDEDNECPTKGTMSEMADCTAYTCDGTTWFKLTDLSPGPSSYTRYPETDIGSNCDDVNSSFSIAFCHKDNYPLPTDGFYYDDIDINATGGNSDAPVDVYLDLNMALPNDSNLSVCTQNSRIGNDNSICFDINASSEALIVSNLAYDLNQMFWWFFDINIMGILGHELVIDYQYRADFYAS